MGGSGMVWPLGPPQAPAGQAWAPIQGPTPPPPVDDTVGTGFDYWFDGAPVMVLADGGGFDYWDPGAPVVTG